MEAMKLYEHVEMTTIPKVSLVIMCYKRIIELLQQAIHEIQKGQYDRKSDFLSKAVTILTELISALDFKKGKQVAYGLNNIYLYCLNKIIEADSKDDPEVLSHVIDILEGINDAWEEVSKKKLNKDTGYDSLRLTGV